MTSKQSLAKLQKDLKANINNKIGTQYKTITQFKKHFGLQSNDETWEYLDDFDRKNNELEIVWIKKPKKKVKPSEKVIKTGLETEKYFKEKGEFTKRPVILFSIDFQNGDKEYQYGDLDEIWNKKFKPVLNRLVDLYKNGYWQIDFVGMLFSKNGTEGRKKSLEALLIDKSSYNSIYKQLREFLYQYVLQGEKLILLEIDIKVIKPLSGGCYSCEGRGKNIKIDNLTLYNPYSNNNNCLFRLIEDNTDFKMTKNKCNEIRKEFKIKDNEMVDLINADLICKKYCKKTVSFITNKLDVIRGHENGEIKILYLNNHFLLLKGETKRCLDCGVFYLHKHKCDGKVCNFYNQKILKRLIAKVDRKDKGLLNKEILHYDIETHYNNLSREHTPYIVGYCYYDNNELKYEVIAGDGCMKRLYEQLGTDKFKHVKYLNAFNGSNFDHYYLFRVKMEETKKVGKFILNNGSLLNADIQGKRLIDLGKHLTGSLSSNLKQNGCSIAKGSIDHNLSTDWETTNEVRKKDVLEYLKCDVLGLCELYEKVNEPIYSQFKTNLCESLTTSSSAFTIWRDRFLKDGVKIYLPDNEMENNIRQAIYGGRCYKNKNRFVSKQRQKIINGEIKYDDIDDYIFDADVVSLYPTAMLEKFPVGKEIKTNLYQENKMGIYKIKYTAPKNLLTPILPRKEDGRLKWDLRDGEGWYSSVDIENAKEKGYVVEIITGYYWNETDYVFKEYIEEFYKIKQNSKKGTPAYTTAKLYLNALYGKMIQRAINSKDAIISTSEEFWEILNKNIIQEISEVNDKWLIRYIPKEEYLIPSGAEKPTQLGIFILAYSRRIMNGYYDKCGNTIDRLPYYYDTDSLNIHSSCLDKIKINKELGGIDDDVGGKVIRAIYIAPKMYALQYVTQDNKIHYHFRGKGVSNDVLNWKDFEDMDNGESKKYYRNFQMKKINMKKSKKDKDLNHFSHKHIMSEDTGKVVNNIKWSGRNFIDDNNSIPYGFCEKYL